MNTTPDVDNEGPQAFFPLIHDHHSSIIKSSHVLGSHMPKCIGVIGTDSGCADFIATIYLGPDAKVAIQACIYQGVYTWRIT